jgi:uncharacterized membrane protein
MTSKSYLALKSVIAAVLGAVFSISIAKNNAIIPIIALAAGFAVVIAAKSRVKQIVADERDYEISGKAARIAIQIFSIGVIIPMVLFYAAHDTNPAFEPVASALAYSACFLMLTYAGITKYLQRSPKIDNKTPYIILLALAIGIVAIAGLRALSGEDGWTCEHGSWTMHGRPSTPAPNMPCTK